jgi:hypothetical protein
MIKQLSERPGMKQQEIGASRIGMKPLVPKKYQTRRHSTPMERSGPKNYETARLTYFRYLVSKRIGVLLATDSFCLGPESTIKKKLQS